ncbi:DUF2612 domain-containing protein [Cloacibacillus sp. An23]|uniref:DUF2612 domain-containing protein n=1 Tax=Cloacibacillus sp. An23 TaxID=1965591 RepID=UPI000B39A934|nr:DUF2612 domain-containing protein [Cloacibacillus sp. An23]OUO94814.1 hypothetical protein B5F39_02800 [Cloacibacillus sp. An23]
MIDFHELNLETIQSQYGASPHLRGIIEAAAKRIDPNSDINTFYEKIFNLDTAEGIGLDIWGQIVAVPRRMLVPSGEYFGFDGSQLNPFNQAPFYNSATLGEFYELADEAYRKLIYYKAMANISEDTAEAQNRLLSLLFGDVVTSIGLEGIVPNGIMKIRVIFYFYLSSYEIEIFKNYGLLNRGAGVGWEYYQIDPDRTFGFDGSGLQPFNQGTFDGYGIVQGA